jgi:hypothetical protein
VRGNRLYNARHEQTSHATRRYLIRRVDMIGTSVPYHFHSTWARGLSGK